MKSSRSICGVLGLIAGLMMMPSSLDGARQTQDEHNAAIASQSAGRPSGKMKMGMMASDAKLDELVKRMNAAKGAAKVDAMAELLTALIENQRATCGPMMADMMTMMSMMRKMGDGGHDSAPPDPQK
jgi:hypothetical protein